MRTTVQARSWRTRVGLALAVGALLAVIPLEGAAAQAPPAAPDPVELCAALEGQPGYEECLTATGDALDGVVVPSSLDASEPAAGDDADKGTDGATLSEQNLQEQRELLWIIVAVVLVVVFIVVALSWRRSMRRMRESFSPEALALMEQLIPPEVRATRPDLTVADGLTEKERALLRGQRNLIVVLLILPAGVFVLLQVWEPSIDTSIAIGEIARIAPLVLAVPAMLWARRRVRRAMESGEDRWAILGLAPESGPDVVVAPRFTGGLRAMVVGDTVLSGRRHGRDVRIEMGAGSVRTAVQVPGVPDRPPTPEGGPDASLCCSAGWVVLERRISGAALAGPDGLTVVLRDLQRAEQVADTVVTA